MTVMLFGATASHCCLVTLTCGEGTTFDRRVSFHLSQMNQLHELFVHYHYHAFMESTATPFKAMRLLLDRMAALSRIALT